MARKGSLILRPWKELGPRGLTYEARAELADWLSEQRGKSKELAWGDMRFIGWPVLGWRQGERNTRLGILAEFVASGARENPSFRLLDGTLVDFCHLWSSEQDQKWKKVLRSLRSRLAQEAGFEQQGVQRVYKPGSNLKNPWAEEQEEGAKDD